MMDKLKRIIDLTLTLLALPIAIVIIILIIPIIKLDSDGPILYSAKRIGKAGKTIEIYKLRTMYNKKIKFNDKKYKLKFKLENDPRITRIGKFLRRSSLDELPQLINVVKGDMSLVGPRPLLLEETKTYPKKAFVLYCSVKPGLTGLWQISGRNNLPYAEKAKLDSEYVKNIGFWSDIKILIKTIKVLFTCEGAY